MNNKVCRTNIAYYIIQGFYWMSICVSNNYAAFYLQSRGYSNSQLGVILALGNIAGFILSPILASVVDRSKRNKHLPLSLGPAGRPGAAAGAVHPAPR